jgi:hypothetical protein
MDDYARNLDDYEERLARGEIRTAEFSATPSDRRVETLR